ncbi:ankyrin repeat domain-containing protein [Ancylobacter polymorphus]|uniref:Ankyrin repeat domain-containing protein n=1 Tax=Ancylobacter polymorphus TaxID=223390 RepID=A0A9E7ABQ4_9HYPH|nr:ankyrin repeat domain-containing protein [Ancylobacter polymorphus]UOK73338.1 ankyrin repeat domain-containing protein [Ancylobacter polymorphus]
MSRTLTSRTSVESLRKEAKRWLRALHAPSPAAANRFRAAWPDGPAEPLLRHVQHALAREYGCESWVALRQEIEQLARAGGSNADRVKQLLRHGWDGDPALARHVLDRYPAIARDSIFTAAASGNLAEVRRRLAGDPAEATRTDGVHMWTALTHVTYGRLDAHNAVAIARLLLDAGADPNFGFDDGWGSPFTVLTGAIGRGEQHKPSHPQVQVLVDLLVAAGADPFDRQSLYNISVDGKDIDWYERLWQLCLAKGLTSKWSDPDAWINGGTIKVNTLDYLLGNAVGQNHLERAAWLLRHGASANAPQAYNGWPMHKLAQISGFLDMVSLLERHGAEPAKLTGAQAFQAACLRQDEAAARALLATDPGLVKDATPLLAAAEFGNAGAVALLLTLGASARALDADGISPLHRAVQSGSLEAVELLLGAGGDVDLTERRWGGTPLSWAAVMGQSDIFERLAALSRDVRTLGYRAKLDRLEAVLRAEPERANQISADGDGPTPLFILPGDPDLAAAVARILLAYGADPAVKNAKGQTPAEVARDIDFDEAAELMERATDAYRRAKT